jgi:peptidoglycan/xylan/chitin deacetylase (PgdA/CDA1 family)
VHLSRPIVRAVRQQARYLPILMYHSIGPSKGHPGHQYYETQTSLNRFIEQMAWLHDHAYNTVSLDAVLSGDLGPNWPANPVVITFDDGYKDFYTRAFPVLSTYDFQATVFVPTGFISDQGIQFNSKDCLTWSDLSELHREGIGIGSHSVSHSYLHRLTEHTLKYELNTSKNQLEQALGAKVTCFAYPYAFPEHDRGFKKRLLRQLLEAGYLAAASTIIGTNDRSCLPFYLKRLPINEYDDQSLFQAKLEGAYDWLHSFQWLYKRFWQSATE